jgi:hypothetical protein
MELQRRTKRRMQWRSRSMRLLCSAEREKRRRTCSMQFHLTKIAIIPPTMKTKFYRMKGRLKMS